MGKIKRIGFWIAFRDFESYRIRASSTSTIRHFRLFYYWEISCPSWTAMRR